MRHIDLMPPLVDGDRVTFRWHVEPATALYRRTEFTLAFPAGFDLSGVPARLWWDILFICLHPHWLLLRPCQIRVPLKITAEERQFWLQLLQNGADTLAVYGPARIRAEPLGITILSGELELPRTRIPGAGAGTSFSSGKDSLLQAGLLCELTERPLLVTTTSPLPPLADHGAARRRRVLASIQQRRDVRLVEVTSDFRSSWDNSFAASRGYPLGVNELTDTLLYTSSLLAAGAAVGATRLFVASEAEVQASAVLDGKIVQHTHFMYSAATQRALDRLLAPYGIRLGSLIWPLYSVQVQRLLWARYPDLCDLQYSCWRVQSDEETCSQCEQCFRIALTALADGEDPERMGIDLPKVLAFASEWAPLAGLPPVAPITPQSAEALAVDARVMDTLRRVSLIHLARRLARTSIRRLASRETRTVLRDFRAVRRRARRVPAQPPLGVREAFFDWLDPELRESLVAIYTQHFPREPRRRHRGLYERSRMLTLRATSSLG